MATLAEINQLVQESKCFTCLTADQQLAVITYLLAKDAGGSLSPSVLLEEATRNGFTTLRPNQNSAIQTGLLCSIADALGVA